MNFTFYLVNDLQEIHQVWLISLFGPLVCQVKVNPEKVLYMQLNLDSDHLL